MTQKFLGRWRAAGPGSEQPVLSTSPVTLNCGKENAIKPRQSQMSCSADMFFVWRTQAGLFNNIIKNLCKRIWSCFPKSKRSFWGKTNSYIHPLCIWKANKRFNFWKMLKLFSFPLGTMTKWFHAAKALLFGFSIITVLGFLAPFSSWMKHCDA